MRQGEGLADAGRIYLLPSFFTAANLFFGFLAMIRCIQAKYVAVSSSALSHDYYIQAVWCVLLAAFCDALDGRLARLGKKESLFGREFDSIADMVSFGVAPSLMVFFLVLSPTEGYPFFREVGWLIGFIYLLCGGVRLARFNAITHPALLQEERGHGSDFLGLPITVAAGVIVSLVLVLNSYDLNHWSLLLPPLMLGIAYLMVSNVPFPSFKKIDWNTRTRLQTFVVLFSVFLTIFLCREFSLAFIFFTYVGFGTLRHLRRLRRRRRR
ncbi:MAG: CDP-diacylglycerol--serine O-phosphatidyltransferase [Puniceicoccales bacterium]|jgi:CDP-diacylglycerol--serine O-phosphatidyltransferase|nr:CDP-diacylglycerol--serine O-phosphatidyltransferase [Puniceicoccales bacterium]